MASRPLSLNLRHTDQALVSEGDKGEEEEREGGKGKEGGREEKGGRKEKGGRERDHMLYLFYMLLSLTI